MNTAILGIKNRKGNKEKGSKTMNELKKQISKVSKSLLVLLISFSQICFPISVLAEQIDGQVENNNHKITINDIELTEDNFNIESASAKQIKIIQNYIGEDEPIYSPTQELELDFTNRLYGKYTYSLSVSNESELLSSRNITINHIGDNNQIINTNNIYYNNNTYFILGDLATSLTKLDVINKFNNNLSIYNATLNLFDTENNQLLEDADIVEDNYQLNVKATYTDEEIVNEIEETYTLNIVEDINEDGTIDNKDIQKELIQQILAEKDNETASDYNVLDVTNVVIDNPNDEATDNLTTTFEYNNNIFLDQEIVLNYYIEGFNEETLKGIEGNINYDKNILELNSIEINSIDGGINENGHFIYLLDDYKEDGLLMTIKFTPLSVGSTSITLDNLVGSTGATKKALLDTNNFEGEVTILEYGKGSDVEEEITTPDNTIEENEETTANETTEEVTLTVNETKKVSTTYVRPVLLSGDNTIKTLSIKKYDIEFDSNVFEYQLKVKSSVKSLDLDIVLNDSNASYVVKGNENFKSGENTVEIIVTAENGDTKTYTIKVNKEAKEVIEESTEEQESKSATKAVIIVLIILVIVGLVYIIFKDDKDDEE